MTTRQRVTVASPAKVNLGLEILGRRPDGFHNLSSLMAMLDLSDTLSLWEGEGGQDIAGVPAEKNLVTKALAEFGSAVADAPHFGWSLVKRVPAAAGLGGASGNAASALLAANVLTGNPLTPSELCRIAAKVGSDVPFFLGTTAAIAEGVGDRLTPVNLPAVDIALIVPRISIAEKTRTLYGAIVPGDFTCHGNAHEVATVMCSGRMPHPDLLANGFLRALRSLIPAISSLVADLEAIPNLAFGLSGAGPTFYVLRPSNAQVRALEMLARNHSGFIQLLRTAVRTVPVCVETR